MSPAVRAFLLLPALFSAADYYREAASMAPLPRWFTDCAMDDTATSFGIDIHPAFASKIRGATIVACWRGTCRTAPLDFMLDKQFAVVDMLDLPVEPVRVALHFTDNDGTALPARTTTVIPHRTYPKPRCGDDAPRANLRIDAKGHLLPTRFPR